MLLRITSVALLGLVLVGCDLPGTKLEKAQRVDPDGSTFNVNLYQGYIDLASSEYNEGDYTAGRSIRRATHQMNRRQTSADPGAPRRDQHQLLDQNVDLV